VAADATVGQCTLTARRTSADRWWLGRVLTGILRTIRPVRERSERASMSTPAENWWFPAANSPNRHGETPNRLSTLAEIRPGLAEGKERNYVSQSQAPPQISKGSHFCAIG
jgi:hypothetical protein